MGSRVEIGVDSLKYKSRDSAYTLTVRDIGFMGEGSYSSYNSYKAHQSWCDVIKRCYCEEFLEKNQTYQGCSVHRDWHNFQNFAKWYTENYIEGWKLDKDILVDGNKIYGPETCCFVPQIINCQFTVVKGSKSGLPRGVQKKGKRFIVETKRLECGKKTYLKPDSPFRDANIAHEAWKEYKVNYIKELAEEHRDLLEPKVYNKLINTKL